MSQFSIIVRIYQSGLSGWGAGFFIDPKPKPVVIEDEDFFTSPEGY